MRQTKVLSPLPTPPSREMQKGTLAPAAFETPRARVRAAAGRGLTSGKPLQPPHLYERLSTLPVLPCQPCTLCSFGKLLSQLEY